MEHNLTVNKSCNFRRFNGRGGAHYKDWLSNSSSLSSGNWYVIAQNGSAHNTAGDGNRASARITISSVGQSLRIDIW